MTIVDVSFPSRDGRRARGALAAPDGATPAPALLLVHEWWGLNAHVRDLAERLAAAGFLVLAPDLYDRPPTQDAAEALERVTALDGERSIEELAGARAWLAAHPRSNGAVGIVGFCLGGAFAFRAAARLPELGAAVPFYGVPPQGTADWDQVRCPIQAHFGARDGHVPPTKAEAIREQLAARGRPMELHVYDAGHAFVNDTRPESYDAASATLAWSRTVAFLHAHLDAAR